MCGARTESGYFPEQNSERPDVAVRGEDAVAYRLERHPLERQTAVRQLAVLVAGVDQPSQAEVAQLDHLVGADEHVAGGQIAVHVLLLRQILLRKTFHDNTVKTCADQSAR